jgi:hypothetical protein
MLERLTHRHAKDWVDNYVSLELSDKSVGWPALIKPAIRKHLGLLFSTEMDDNGKPWVDADEPLSYLRWDSKEFIQRLLRAFPDDQICSVD